MADLLLMEKSIDPAVRAVLPSGGQVLSVKHQREKSSSAMTVFKVKISLKGEKIEYHLKVISHPNHSDAARGEFESQKLLGHHIPDNVTLPLAYGLLERDPSSSFLLTEFLRSNKTVANTQPLAEVLGRLHQAFASPNEKFGFHVTTYNDIVPLVNDWCDTWEEYFGRQLKSDIDCLHSIWGPDPDFDEVAGRVFEKVIPRLLRPLKIKPVLLHGNVWPSNVKFDEATQHIILYDSCCFFGHSEFDLAMTRQRRYKFTKEDANMYRELVPPSDPVEDYDDRNAIYALRKDIVNLCLHGKNSPDDEQQALRAQVVKEMKRLIRKYPSSIAGYKAK
ncbi:Fructosamine kinase-domain-containing protein [Nemania sp. FL0031]|nr:Fructosamine kinase-domain-containing protein [Nemania sp. FL0031]